MAMEAAVKFEIFVFACQLAVCREDILLVTDREPMQMQIVQTFAAWAAKHEGWRVERFGSRRAGRAVAKV